MRKRMLSVAESAKVAMYINQHKPSFNGKTLVEIAEMISLRLKFNLSTRTVGNLCKELNVDVAEESRRTPLTIAHERINLIGEQVLVMVESLGIEPLPEFAARFKRESNLEG